MAVFILIDEGDSDQGRTITTQQLLGGLRRHGVDARRVAVPADTGSKVGTAYAIGELILHGTQTTVAIGAVAQVVVAFVKRGRKVVLEDGNERLEVDGVSAAQRHAIIEDWLRRHQPAPPDPAPEALPPDARV